MNPEVSVVISVFNCDQYIREAIDSVLNQSFSDFELMVVDDGSTDKTSEILKTFTDRRIKIITQKNQGRSKSLNAGINCSAGKYIAIVDSDDIVYPFRLEEQSKFLNLNPDYVGVGGYLDFSTQEGTIIYQHVLPTAWDKIAEIFNNGGNPLFQPAMMFRKIEGLQCGLYKEQLIYAEDRDFLKRLAKTGRITNLPISVGKYRIRPGAISNQPTYTLKKWSNLAKKSESTDLTNEEKSFLRNSFLQRKENIDWSLYALRVGKAYLLHTRDIHSARKYFRKSIRYWIYNFPAWFNFLISYFPDHLKTAILSRR